MRATSAALAATLAATVMVGVAGTASANRGNDAETVRLLDDCHAKSFNEALEREVCVGDGDTTFPEFMTALEEGGDGHWKNNPEDTDVDEGEGLHLVNRGGEFHTFTKVEDFADGGCVEEINGPLGVPTRDEDFCESVFANPFAESVLGVPAGGERAVPASVLEVGHNHFQCLIHPWMQTTVHVHEDD